MYDQKSLLDKYFSSGFGIAPKLNARCDNQGHQLIPNDRIHRNLKGVNESIEILKV
jgi:hypothetical protein